MIILKLAGAILGTFLTSDVIENSMKNYDTDIQPPRRNLQPLFVFVSVNDKK